MHMIPTMQLWDIIVKELQKKMKNKFPKNEIMCKDKWNSLNSNYKITLEQIIAKGQVIILIYGIYHLKKKNVSICPGNSIDNFISWLRPFKRKMLSMFFDILKM